MKIDMNLDLGASTTAEDWVKSSRVKEKDAKAEAKRLAELKQQQLEEEEEELLEQSRSLYNSTHLKGLKVMHAANDFEEGQDVILTLKDTGILEKDEDGKVIGLNEEGDALENVNFADKDRRMERESKKRRLNQPIYSALDDYEFQDGVATGSRAPLLPQYEREKKAAAKFELGEGGTAAFDPNAIENARAVASAAKVQSLLSMAKESSDYYSAKEYTSFTKTKKSKKSKSFRKKSSVDDEDAAEASASSAAELADSGVIESKEMEVDEDNKNSVAAAPKKAPLVPIKFQSMDLDEDDPDMAQALARSRRLALQARKKEESASIADMAGVEDRGALMARALAAKIEVKHPHNNESAANNTGDDDDIDVEGRRANGALVFNSTTEFSTRLQAHLNEKARAKTEALMRDVERNQKKEKDSDKSTAAVSFNNGAEEYKEGYGDESVDEDDDGSREGEEGVNGMKKKKQQQQQQQQEVDISGTMEDFAGISDMEDSDMDVDNDGGEDDGSDAEDDDQLGFVHRQPLVGKGMAATLALLKGSGELKRTEQLAGRAKDSRAFDPSSTDHGVKLEYRNEFGRKLTQKEAFRQLSYKFHGYGPSQKKKEKRLKALELQNKANSSRAGILEGVGGTMKSLTQAQEATGRAHITIQGGASSAVPPLQLSAMIAKKKGSSGASTKAKK